MQDAPIPNIVCVGTALWDFVGRMPFRMQPESDVAGKIQRKPGGVALNIAVALFRFGMPPVLLSSIERHSEGADLLGLYRGMGILVDYVHITECLPTDRCLILEDVDRMVANVADVRSLEAAGDRILHPLLDGRLGEPESP